MAKSRRRTVRRAGLPPRRSIVMEKVLVPGRRRGRALGAAAARAYRILRTNEVDPKDRPMPRAAVRAFAAAAPPSDRFAGTARRAAKLSLAGAAIEVFGDLGDLLATLPSKTAMTKRKPKIRVDASSNRVAEEKRNVRLTAFLYAASREDDNDYHLIVGRDPATAPHIYMTVELAGLPRKNAKSFAALKSARDAYKTFFGRDLPGSSYDFYDPPIPLEIEGSLFFDMSHASGQGPGPQSLHDDIPTIWEIHPVSRIVFEP